MRVEETEIGIVHPLPTLHTQMQRDWKKYAIIWVGSTDWSRELSSFPPPQFSEVKECLEFSQTYLENRMLKKTGFKF
ncbi:hypothetical protein CEXT_406411 [Caerostris extrusa]|uniref:Uncharacterized protein n=1 Tax=Caerostris extrusa TaxID=172846 RepID=A0AAV4QS75_CAEEX|nr:hypothetical protein CEXT_406411 [Caerostris extrusa]